MSNNYFQFKQFTVHQDKCAMKVGTDGVLLGAWTDTSLCKRMLDIGTGTGVIALILAQRSEAAIDAIDIDSDACLQAQENADASPFRKQIQVVHAALADYACRCSTLYDRIVSNPPYFSNSLRCSDQQRNMARHNDTLPLDELLQTSRKLLAPKGRIALILPYDQKEELTKESQRQNLFPVRKTTVVSVFGLPPKRLLVELTAESSLLPTENQLTIEQDNHSYSDAYIQLTKAFYLKM